MLPTPPRKEYAPGDVISDKYRLLQLLGEGGMGSVWVAENMALKANVALKLIRADVAEASANDRFLSEARLAARLQHAAIVRVFDFGKTQNDEPFIVMELLEGETLGQRLTRLGSIDPVELGQTLLPIIDALHSAHGHGVIHRDLKPDNVFIAKAEGGGVQPKLLDFGIAKLRGESAFHTTKLTQAGTLIGSPDYMSPEQAKGETDLDPRSDVWALCVLAYECLVGKPPFHGDNYNALLWSIIHDEPVPITVFQAGDSELWRLLKKGFSKDRNGRWESARKFGEALALWLENHGIVEDVCNRSLHASWLPAERPTQPELIPFDGLATTPGQRAISQAALVPPPTLPSLRRPHRWAVWFAAAGVATLAVALFKQSTGEDDALVVEARPAKAAEARRFTPASAAVGPITAGAPARPQPGVDGEPKAPPLAAGARQGASPAPEAPKTHRFEPDGEEIGKVNAYADTKDLWQDEREQPIVRHSEAPAGEEAIAPSKPIAPQPSATRPSATRPSASEPPAPKANPPPPKGLIATPAPANKPKPAASHPKPKKPEVDEYDFGI
ncbi:MAG TPA: protein kinase [Polyangiaceae bacterium]|nr:protein kinase [Polyangiaceae bacterium]